MAAKHIEVAKTQGAKEGFKMWKTNLKRSGIPQVQARYDELLSQGDVEAQFRYYCAEYGDKFGLTTTPKRSSGTTKATAAAPTADLFAQFQAFLAAQTGDTEDAEEIDEDDEDAILDALDEPVAVASTTTTRAGKPTTRRAAAPNADPFAPRDPAAHATNGRLWKLNELGLLRIAKNPGTAITNGDAHAVLKALL
jgi:hypothetical protein